MDTEIQGNWDTETLACRETEVLRYRDTGILKKYNIERGLQGDQDKGTNGNNVRSNH